MDNIFFLQPDVRFEDKLIYSERAEWDTKLCPLNTGLPSQHALRGRQPNPICAVGPVQRLSDVEWTVYRDLLLEQDIVEKLLSAQFSGFELRPAELYTTTETPVGREVFQLRVTGWGGVAPPESGIHVVEECPHCKRQVFSGFTNINKLFPIDDWDGSDFFIIWPLPKYTFVTNEVAQWFKKSELSGIVVRPLDEFPKAIAGGYAPGHLHDWFDDPKLEQIRAKLR